MSVEESRSIKENYNPEERRSRVLSTRSGASSLRGEAAPHL